MTNEQRADRFYRAMLMIRTLYDEDADMQTSFIDLLTDARHEEVNGTVEVAEAVALSEIHFNAEEGEDED